MPVEITVSLLKKAMEKNGWSEKRYLIDGFPRNQDNYEGWQKQMEQIVNIPFIFFFEVSERKNILIYKNRDPCGLNIERAESSGRNDDNIETLKKRLTTFNEQTLPVVNMYDKQGKCRKIDGSG